jgi:two-component system response regulator
MADDDADDRMLMKEALEENNLPHSIFFVEDGEELLDYLQTTGKFSKQTTVVPNLILLDLNMPKVDGREVLGKLKRHASLRRIPVIVLTTSSAREDIAMAYDLGVNSFICKPAHFNELVEVAREITKYWFSVVTLPAN